MTVPTYRIGRVCRKCHTTDTAGLEVRGEGKLPRIARITWCAKGHVVISDPECYAQTDDITHVYTFKQRSTLVPPR